MYPSGYHGLTSKKEPCWKYPKEVPCEIKKGGGSPSITNLNQNLWLSMLQLRILSPPSKSYARTLPHCTKCNFHHIGNYKEIICNNYNLRGHITRYSRKTPTTTTSITTSGGCCNGFECNQRQSLLEMLARNQLCCMVCLLSITFRLLYHLILVPIEALSPKILETR